MTGGFNEAGADAPEIHDRAEEAGDEVAELQ